MFTTKPISRIFSDLFVMISLLGLTFSLLGFTVPVQAAPADSTDIPSGLSDADWKQIKALLPTASINAQQAYLKASNTGADDGLGEVVAISGNTVVVGASSEDSNATGVNGNQADNSAPDSGAVYVFTRSANTWSQQAYLKSSNSEAGDLFGISIAISGDTLVVGAYGESSNATGVNGNQADNSVSGSGAVYVFVRSDNAWSQQAYIKASSTDVTDIFGSSVDILGDTLVVGAYGEDSSATGVNGNEADNSESWAGAAYVFTRNGITWSQEAYLKASNTDGGDFFGTSVALSTDTVVVGALGESSSATGVNGDQTDNSTSHAGAAYVFTRSGTVWSQQAYLKASTTGGKAFGESVAISGDTLVVGAPGESSNATGVNGNQVDQSAGSSGAAYVFTRSGNDWSQQAYIKASNTGTGDVFGESVAIAGDTLVVGAFQEASKATGLNGNQSDNSAHSAGAVYVFARSSDVWSQETYLKASNTQGGDRFGISVAIDDGTVVVGAFGEDGNATGVNVDQGDNSASFAGAAYIFANTPPVVLSKTFLPVAAQDGWVLESSEISNKGGKTNSGDVIFRVGDDVANKQYRSILHFDTSSLPDTAVITNATLKIMKRGFVGTNPFTTHNGLQVDIRKSYFGTNATLQSHDFQALSSYSAATLFNPTPEGRWYSSEFLDSEARVFVHRTGTTQFRLRFGDDDNNDDGADFMSFYSGNAPAASRPKLIINYYIP